MPGTIVPLEKYLEMNWRVDDKVGACGIFKKRIKVIFMTDGMPLETQYILILVVGGDEALNHLNTLQEQVKDPKDPEQVWNIFEKRFEETNSHWDFCD